MELSSEQLEVLAIFKEHNIDKGQYLPLSILERDRQGLSRRAQKNWDELIKDLVNATRETIAPYGCSENSVERDDILISHNLWRDQLARYLGLSIPTYAQCYWDLQTMHNTGEQSLGFTDTYVNETRSFSPRGIAAIGALLAYPRLIIDRLAPGGARISVEPDRDFNQRWPLFPLADWAVGKIPVCVVNEGEVFIENDADPVFVRGEQSEGAMIG